MAPTSSEARPAKQSQFVEEDKAETASPRPHEQLRETKPITHAGPEKRMGGPRMQWSRCAKQSQFQGAGSREKETTGAVMRNKAKLRRS